MAEDRDILNRIADALQLTLARRMEAALRWLRANAAGDIAYQAARGGPEAAADALPERYKDILTTALKPVDAGFQAGGNSTIERAFDRDAKAKLIAVDFDARNDRVLGWLATYKMNLIREITDSQRDAIRVVVASNVGADYGPDDTARRLRRDLQETLGLTSAQAEHVINYRRELENLQSGALARSLRDRRYDRTVAKAIETGTNLTGDQIQAMVDAYQRRYIAYRAMTIARTESLRATNLGSNAALREAVETGALGEVVIRKTWIATRDARTRDTHRDLNGQSVVGLDTPFVTTRGNSIRWPHDPEAPAEETINCVLPGTLVYANGVSAVSRSEYDGEAISIQTAGGAQLSCTINHPVLTTRGWVPAQFLVVGDRVVRCRAADWDMQVVDGEDGPARIEDVEHALGVALSGRTATQQMSLVDFHGEGRLGKVGIVSTDGNLWGEVKAAIRGQGSKSDLGRGLLREGDLSGSRASEELDVRLGSPARSGVRRPESTLSLALRHLAPLEGLGFAPAADRDPHLAQPQPDDVSGDGQVLGELLRRHPALIEADEIVHIERNPLHGPVLNLETDSGIYLANGIVNHNCRCTLATHIFPRT